MRKEDPKQPGCVLRLFGPSALAVQQATAALPAGWKVRIQCRSQGAETLVALQGESRAGLEKARRSLQGCFGAALYGEGDQGLAAATVAALEQHRRLLVCADGAAGALVEARLEAVPGAEKVFDFGTQSYAHPDLGPQIARRGGRLSALQQAVARVQGARQLLGVELAVGCVEQAGQFQLLLGSKKGCWLRTVYPEDRPGLWLLDMIRRAACGLPQVEGTSWHRYGDPVPDPEAPAEAAAAPPGKKRHPLRKLLGVLVLLAALALAVGWWYTEGDLTALPQKLQSLGAESQPHSGAKLV